MDLPSPGWSGKGHGTLGVGWASLGLGFLLWLRNNSSNRKQFSTNIIESKGFWGRFLGEAYATVGRRGPAPPQGTHKGHPYGGRGGGELRGQGECFGGMDLRHRRIFDPPPWE